MKLSNIVGARPNFMKIASIIQKMKKHSEIEQRLVHTGQHYDVNMSKLFFSDLGTPKPDIYLGVGSGSHAEQTARIMIEFERVLLKEKPNLVLVVGDVNSTLACALTSVKLQFPVAHVEAGLRSFDRTMPEEINRILTDAISEYLFITEKSAETNLLKEGRPKEKIYFVGNVMIDTLLNNREKADKSQILSTLNLEPKNYAVLTLHRPSNVDKNETFRRILKALEEVSRYIKIVYPIHPRSRTRLEEFGFFGRFNFSSIDSQPSTDNGLIMIDPLGYLHFLKLMSESKFVLTDSGGIQEETTILEIPCMTLRENTERPITEEEGTNVVVGSNKERIIDESFKIMNANKRESRIPTFWDGKAAKRIVDILLNEKYRLRK